MVFDRCKMAVKAGLMRLGLHPFFVLLGEVEIAEAALTDAQSHRIRRRFHETGFELLENERNELAVGVKMAVIELLHHDNNASPIKHSEYLAERIRWNYPHLSKLFSSKPITWS